MRIDKDNIKIILILLVVCLGIGYSYLNTELNINGTANINSANWSVYWNNVQVSNGSVEAETPVIDTNKTTVSFNVTLTKPGDYYEFTVDAVNAGTIDAMIETMNFKLNGVTATGLPAYLYYNITYSDDYPLEYNQALLHDSTETYKIRIAYSENIEAEDLPEENQSLSLEFAVTYKQATEAAVPVIHSVSFAEDDWSTIIAAAKAGTIDYHVGDTKTVDMGTFGTHTIRIANMSIPEECSNPDFSETACGFVLEFADIITTHRMNPYDSTVTTTGNGSIGGWPASEMRTYVNSSIYNALPTELKSGIIDTTVVSGHGSNDSANFTSTDKLYLLSTHEIYEDDDENASDGIDYYDTAYNNTRQLDYYSSQNVTISNHSGAAKKRNGSVYYWWYRSANLGNYYAFYGADLGGFCSTIQLSHYERGVSPAFRIALKRTV